MTDFVMPKLGSDMSVGTLVAWHRKVGDAVHRGDVVADVETDKGVIGVEVFADGVIDRIVANPGDRVPVGAVLANIRTDAESGSPVAPASPTIASRRPRISPSARALAAQLGVDVNALHGTGPDGAVTREDVERTVPKSPAAPIVGDRQTKFRQAIAAAMSRSKREIPHYYLSTTIDLHAALTWLEVENRNRSVEERLLCGVLFLKAVALALREVPELNAVWDGGHVTPSSAIHLGVAVSLRQGGLVAPAIHDADRRDVGTLMAMFKDLVGRARSGALRSSELSEPTITVTSLGDRGVEALFPIIYPPQVAIVGFGKVVRRPWVVGDAVVPRSVVTATLAADHRVSDGHRGALFLAAVDRLLQEPEKL